MSDNKKYYYLKLKENFFESDEMKILQSMADGYIYSDILLKLYLKSLRENGRLMYRGIIPYTPDVLATLTGHSIGIVEKALDILQQLKLVEILDNGVIYMMDIQNFIGKSSSEADRQREYQNRIKLEKTGLSGNLTEENSNNSCKFSNMESSNKSSKESCEENDVVFTPEIRDKRLENRKESKEKKTNYQQIADLYNDTCVSLPRVTTLSEARKKAIRARLNTYSLDDFKRLFELAESSSFLKGQNSRNWSANFDWLIKDANMAKVLDGQYSDTYGSRGNASLTVAPVQQGNRFNNFTPRSNNNIDETQRQLLMRDLAPEYRPGQQDDEAPFRRDDT